MTRSLAPCLLGRREPFSLQKCERHSFTVLPCRLNKLARVDPDQRAAQGRRLGSSGNRKHRQIVSMEATNIHEYARDLKEAHGLEALQEAAQKAIDYGKQDDTEQAEMWRRIEAVLKEMQGPHES